MDAEILVSLNEGHHPTRGYMNKIREMMKNRLSGLQTSRSKRQTSSTRF